MLGAQPIPRPGSPAPRLRPRLPGPSAPAATCSEGAGAWVAVMEAPGLRAPWPVWPPVRRARHGTPSRASGGRARHPNFPFWAIFLPEPGSAHTQRPARTGSRHPPRRGAPNTLPAPPPSPPPSARPPPPPSSTSLGSGARGPGARAPACLPASSFPTFSPRGCPSLSPPSLLRCPSSAASAAPAPLRPSAPPGAPQLSPAGRECPPLGSVHWAPVLGCWHHA